MKPMLPSESDAQVASGYASLNEAVWIRAPQIATFALIASSMFSMDSLEPWSTSAAAKLAVYLQVPAASGSRSHSQRSALEYQSSSQVAHTKPPVISKLQVHMCVHGLGDKDKKGYANEDDPASRRSRLDVTVAVPESG